MSDDIVWAYKPLKKLKNQTGIVICDEALAKSLIDSGDAQDPRDGSPHLNEIQEATVTKAEEAPKRRTINKPVVKAD